ncbi:hypothetical protein QBC43DRAFT_341682 [Cladorrhinum sp. PSN259]|nr:hypothetical protein QBC43DRAFT_341682 [Cladorrhinum sp. PSN259]
MALSPTPGVSTGPPPCSDTKHDRLVHFSRCLKFKERDEFRQKAPEALQERIEHQLSRVKEVRAKIATRPEGDFWVSRLADHMGFFRHRPPTRRSSLSVPVMSSARASSTREFLKATAKASQNLGVSRLRALLAAPALIDRGLARRTPSRRHKDSTYRGIRAGVVYFRNGLPYSYRRASGTFPYQWKAIARHFNEQRPSRDDLFEKPKSSPKTHEILRQVIWRGHEREQTKPYTASHSRHLEPTCEVIKSYFGGCDTMALFETMSSWRRQCKSVNEASRLASAKKPYQGVYDRVEDNFYAELRGHNLETDRLYYVARKAIRASTNRFRHITKQAQTRRGAVGRILFCAAKLAALKMSFEDDELIRMNLFANPPLHPRRSIHQAFCKYSGFMPNTDYLDREQVVYRATTPTAQSRSSQGKHQASALPRLLVVDQLWLFVLDKNTIITSFPQRWGVWFNDDPSGVHRRICDRFVTEGKREIGCPYDLVLIIFDICCRVFYENVDFPDRQPLLNYILASSVNFLVTRELAARQELAKLARCVWDTYDSPDNTEVAESHKSILNINPEAGLLRQAEVLRQFHLHMSRLVIPPAGFDNEGLSSIHNLDDVRRAKGAIAGDKNLPNSEKATALWTRSFANDFKVFFEDQYQWSNMLYAAADIKELLERKNDYAGIISAWESAANSIEISNQEKSIMLFSVLSIIFIGAR